MPIPRPLLLALVGAVLVGGAFFASRGLSGTTEESSAPVVPTPEAQPAAPAKPKAPPTTSARQALKGAEVVRSGKFELHVTAKQVDLDATGSFQSQGIAPMPKFRVDLTGKSGGRTLRAGAVSTGQTGFILRGDQALVVQPEGWNALRRARAQAADQGPGGEPFNGYTRKELASFEFRGRDTVDGVPVLHFRGKIDVKEQRSAFADLVELFEKTSLESSVPGTLARSTRSGSIDFWVGADDHIIRRETYAFDTGSGPVEIDYRRSEVNQPQTITAPPNALSKTPIEAGWDRESFGLAFSAMTFALLGIEPGGGRGGDRPAPARETARSDRGSAGQERGGKQRTAPRGERGAPRRGGTSPAAVTRAIERNAVVILFFRQSGADDDAVAGAVNSVRGRRGVAVFTLPVGQAPKYGKVGGANVVRAPTVVLIGRDDQPRIFEGFIDSTTLAQAVADAR